jgi:iron complex outermembrane receptor protein
VGGGTYEEMKQFDTRYAANVLFTPSPARITLPSVRDLTHIQNLNSSVKRNFKAFFVEDIWDITEDLRLTAGFRYDDYSDFGSHVSPRAGLTWEFIKGYDIKLMYAHAFRAPNFNEEYNILFGNLDVDPEEVDTYEVSLGAEFTPSLSGRVTLYHTQAKDLIVGLKSENIGRSRHQGFEFEMKYDFGRGTYLAMNYNYRRSISPHTKVRWWMTPRHTGNIMANIRLSRYLNFYASCHIEDGFRRNVGDPRDNMSGYALVNATLIAKRFLKGYEGLEIRASVFNLLNKDYTSPHGPFIPNDLPRPGRNFMFEMKYTY